VAPWLIGPMPWAVKGLHCQVQQHRAVLADRVQQYRIAELGRYLAKDVEAFGFESVQVAQVCRQGHRRVWVRGAVAGWDASCADGAAI
jgi:hypothetical protein